MFVLVDDPPDERRGNELGGVAIIAEELGEFPHSLREPPSLLVPEDGPVRDEVPRWDGKLGLEPREQLKKLLVIGPVQVPVVS